MNESERARHARDIHESFGIDERWLPPAMKWGPPNTMAHTAGVVQRPEKPIDWDAALVYAYRTVNWAYDPFGLLATPLFEPTPRDVARLHDTPITPRPERDPIEVPEAEFGEFEPAIYETSWFQPVAWAVMLLLFGFVAYALIWGF